MHAYIEFWRRLTIIFDFLGNQILYTHEIIWRVLLLAFKLGSFSLESLWRLSKNSKDSQSLSFLGLAPSWPWSYTVVPEQKPSSLAASQEAFHASVLRWKNLAHSSKQKLPFLRPPPHTPHTKNSVGQGMLHVIVTPLEQPGEQGQVHKQPCWVSGGPMHRPAQALKRTLGRSSHLCDVFTKLRGYLFLITFLRFLSVRKSFPKLSLYRTWTFSSGPHIPKWKLSVE